MFLTILIFIVILGILVFVHEFGHFIVARKSGMKVDEFGFGFPPRIAGIQKIDGKFRWIWGHGDPIDPEKTVYSINLIPLGGFVKILGENNEGEEDPRSFINRPFWGRFLTLVAGVSMNWILAAVLFAIMLAIGVTSQVVPGDPLLTHAHVTNRQILIAELLENGPAAQGGLKAEDIVLSVDGQQFDSYQALQKYIFEHKGQVLHFTVKRINEIKEIDIHSNASPKPEEGPTGIALMDIAKVKLPWQYAIPAGITETGRTTKAMAIGISKIFTSKEVLNSVGGPVKIAQITGEVRKMGVIPLMRLTAILSLNLALLNIVPFPALDGGRVLFLLIEKIRGKRNNQKIEQWVNAVGFVLLLMLMLVVTVKDIVHK